MKPTVGLVISGAVLMLLNGCESADDAKAINDLINQADGNYTIHVKTDKNSTIIKGDTDRGDKSTPQEKETPSGEEEPTDENGNDTPTVQDTPPDNNNDNGDNGTQEEPDTTKPVITLNGKRRMTITQGETFEDPGATATDDRDGEVEVTVNGEVDTSTPGRYKLTYTAKDSAGNKATKVRIVTVKERENSGEGEEDTTNTDDNNNNTHTSSSHTVKVLVMYDKLALDYYGSKSKLTTRINHLFALANQAYKESHIPAKIEAVGIEYFKTSKTNQDALVALHDSRTVQRTRDEYRADTVLLYQANDSGRGQCGISYVPHSITSADEIRDIMFAQVNINCPDTTTPHELGHNMGLRHSHKQNGDTGVKPYNYGLGHGVDRKFGTIMTYDYLFHVDKLTNKFSSPDYECVPGYPCGIPVGEPGEADAARVLKMTMPIVEKVYE